MACTLTQPPATAVGGVSTAPGQGDLDLFSDNSSTTKTDDTAKKPLSKDSILSLYGTNSMSQQAATGEDTDTDDQWTNKNMYLQQHLPGS